ncbi:MAG: Ig-like domain-containing protein [Bacteroidales bacterium]|nr:Ig-like domain-containing protein [Bacteroidales bacterium]
MIMNTSAKTRFSVSVLALSAIILVASACSKKEKTVPVTGIEILPSSMEMFIGQSLPVQVKTLPDNATTAGNLQVDVNKPNIATYENGKVNALSAGSAKLIATCDAVKTEANIKVYWTMSKGSLSYPIKKASGWKVYDSPGVISYYEADFTDGTEHFIMMLMHRDLGKKIDVSKPLASLDKFDTCFLCSVRNNNDNDITIYLSRDENPVIRNEMWDVLPITATGYFSLEMVTGKGYVANIDVSLSNGQKWKLYYEGPITFENAGDY